MYFHVYLIYRFTRTFTDHSSVITKCWGFELQKRKIEPQKPANPCDTRLCSCIFFVNTLQVMMNPNYIIQVGNVFGFIISIENIL